MLNAAGPEIVIAGTRDGGGASDWPGGPRTLTPREPTREASTGRIRIVPWRTPTAGTPSSRVPGRPAWRRGRRPDGGAAGAGRLRITAEAVGRMRQCPRRRPAPQAARGARLIDALLAWLRPDRRADARSVPVAVRANSTLRGPGLSRRHVAPWIERLRW